MIAICIGCILVALQNSENGLYVSLTSFDGVGHDFLELYHQKTKNRLYLQISKRPVPKVKIVIFFYYWSCFLDMYFTVLYGNV